MPKNNNTGIHPNKAVWYATACLLLVAMGIFLYRVDDSHLVSFLLLAGGLTAIHVLPFGRWTVLDTCVGMITLYDLVSCLYADCPLPAIRVSLYSLYALVAYFTFRRLSAWQPAERIVRSGSDVLMGIAVVLAILSFFVFRSSESVSRTRIISAFCFVRWDISPMCGRRYSCLFWGGRAFRAGVMRWF